MILVLFPHHLMRHSLPTCSRVIRTQWNLAPCDHFPSSIPIIRYLPRLLLLGCYHCCLILYTRTRRPLFSAVTPCIIFVVCGMSRGSLHLPSPTWNVLLWFWRRLLTLFMGLYAQCVAALRDKTTVAGVDTLPLCCTNCFS